MLKIGWSRRDVSTDKPVNIPGQFHARINEGVRDPIMINVVAVEDENDVAIFVSGDFVSARDGLIDDIRARVKEMNAAFPAEKILYNITHTHCGPCYYRNDPSMAAPHDKLDIYSPVEYRKFLVEKAAEAITEAYDNREEGGIAYGYGYAVVSHSRRVTYFDDLSLRGDGDTLPSLAINGHAAMYGNTNDDMFAGYEGGADHFINIMFTFDKEEKLTGAIINVPCPSQNSEMELRLTADYWNEVREGIRAKYGDIGIVSQCAAAGDLSPRTLHYLQAEKRRYALKYGKDAADERETCNRRDIAQRICEAFDEVYSWAKKEIIYDAKVKHSVKMIQLEKRLITEEERDFSAGEYEKLKVREFESTDDAKADFKANTILVAARGRAKRIVDRFEEQKEKPKADMELHVIRIGDIAFASNPFELYIDYQHRIQARSPFTQTFIVQLSGQPLGCNDGYLATRRGEANKGYSATMFCNQVSSDGGDTLVEETLKELKELYD